MKKGIKIDGWFDRKAAAEYIGLSEYWLEKHAATDKGPPYIQHGRKVWYRREDLQTWLEDHQNIETTGAGGKNALDNLWDMGRKRRPQLPDAAQLEVRYRDEHGTPLAMPARKAQIWEQLCKSFDPRQRQLLDEMRACNG